MNKLAKQAIDAHGGLERWNRFTALFSPPDPRGRPPLSWGLPSPSMSWSPYFADISIGLFIRHTLPG